MSACEGRHSDPTCGLTIRDGFQLTTFKILDAWLESTQNFQKTNLSGILLICRITTKNPFSIYQNTLTEAFSFLWLMKILTPQIRKYGYRLLEFYDTEFSLSVKYLNFCNSLLKTCIVMQARWGTAPVSYVCKVICILTMDGARFRKYTAHYLPEKRKSSLSCSFPFHPFFLCVAIKKCRTLFPLDSWIWNLSSLSDVWQRVSCKKYSTEAL